ncbi:MAG: hypothetical protein OEY86_20980 [Nitrospira sp.]|nr:hypothetical protein [Nitrospira sp.]
MTIRLVITFFAIFAFQFPIPISVSALVSTAIPSDRDIYFKFDGLNFSRYLHLRRDGTYRQVVREHLYVEEKDVGKWEQNQVGNLLLKSDLHYHSIDSGTLSISVWHRERLDTLLDLRQRIQRFLKNNRSLSFPRDEVERIRERAVIGSPEIQIGDIMVFSARNVQRSDLEELLPAIDQFMASTAKNVFVFKPFSYKGDVIFIEDDRLALTEQIIEEELAGPDHPTHRGDRHGYQEIEISKFNEEIKDTQPFIFFPEMNKLIKDSTESLGQDAAQP